jgi:large subunit ribosomal protein L20
MRSEGSREYYSRRDPSPRLYIGAQDKLQTTTMPRIKRGTLHLKKRKRILRQTKGYKWGRKKLIKQAIEASHKAGAHAYMDRKKKKQTNRRLWQIRLNAAVRQYDLNYSKFVHLLKKKKIDLDRKVLSELAQKEPTIFRRIVEEIKK